MSFGTILDDFLTPLTENLTRENAERILSFKPDPMLEEKVQLLAAKANSGEISVAEQSEYREIIEAFDVVSIIKLRARKVLGAWD